MSEDDIFIAQCRAEAAAMKAAAAGESTPGFFYARDWADKPHRVVYDATNLIHILTHQLEAALERAVKAEERCEAYKGQVESGAKEIERLRSVLLEAREDIRTYVSSRWSEFEDTPDSAVAYIDAALKTGAPSHD